MSTSVSHRRSSWPRRCQTLRSSLEQRTALPADVSRRIHIHPPQPEPEAALKGHNERMRQRENKHIVNRQLCPRQQ